MIFSNEFLINLLILFVVVATIFQILHSKWKVSLGVALLFVVVASVDRVIGQHFGKTGSSVFEIPMILVCIWSLWRLKKPK